MNEDTSLAISGISVADVDANGGDVEVTLSVGSGTLTLADTTGLTFSTGTGAGDASVTFTGTVADINAALTTLSYQGNLNFNGTDTLSVTVNDQANTGSGGALTDTGSFDIAVQAVNDQPHLTLPADQSVNEDTSLAISGISVADVDANGGDVEVTLSVGSGTLTLADTTGLTFSTGTGAGDASVTFTGTVADINAALTTLSYQGNLNFNGTDTLSVTVNDQANTGSGGALTDTGSFDIAVQAVNDQPHLTLPADQSVNEDTSLAISGISVADVDANGGDVEVTLSVGSGTLTLADTTGLTFSTGTGAGDASVTFTGTVADINAALTTLSYQGNLNFNGTDTLSVTVNDQANTGSGGALTDTGSFDIAVQAVNDQPHLTLPADQSVNEDTSLAISGISVADVDANGGDVEVTLSVGSGTLTLADTTGLTFSTGTGAGDASVTFTGTVADINAALTTLSYQGNLNFNGTDTLSVTVNDQANTGSGGALTDTGSFDIAVQAVNDQPHLTLPADQSVNEDTSLAISGISVADVDANGGDVEVTLSVGSGTLTLADTTGLTFSTGTGAGDASVTFTGTVADINAALTTLSYQGNLNFNGTDTLSVTVNDQANTGSGGALTDTGSFDIAVQAVNDQPHLTLPADQSVNEDTSLAISGISVADVDANGGDVEVTLSVGSGTLTLADTTGLTFSTGTGAGDASVTFTGTVADINAALTTLSYQGNLNFNGTDTLSVTVNDQANTGSGGALTDTGSFDIAVQAVNDQPHLTLPADQSVNEDTSLAISGISVADVDANGGDVEVTLSVGSGTLTLADTTGLTFSTGTGAGDASVTFTGTVADINAALTTLSYQGNLNFNGTDTLSVTVNDQANTGSGGALTDTGSFDIAVQAVNDQPHLTLPADQSVNEDTSLAISGISVADVDANGGDVEVTLSVGSGTLTLADTTGLTFSTGTGAGDASVTFTGTVADINAALTTLSYQGNLNFNGTDTLSVTVNDQANTGSGGALTDTGSFDIAVQAVNDQPHLTLPADQSVNEDTSLAISGISVADVDANGGDVEVTLSVGSGTLTLADTTGLTFSTGTGAGDASVTFTGTVADINAALTTLSYQGNLNFNGTDTLSVTVNDQANTGSGGALTDTGSFDIAVQAVNDQPHLTLPADQSVNEDTSLAISGISVADVDANGGDVEVTLSVGSGTLTLADTTSLTFSTGTGAGDASVTFTGTVADINAALTTLSYQGNLNFNGTDTLSVTVNDQANTGSGGALTDTGSFDIAVQAVNDQPHLTLPADQSVNEDTSLAISGISVADVDANGGDVEVTLSVGSGTLTLADTTSLTFSTGTGAGDASVTFTGTVADINAALTTLSYQGNLNFNGTDTLSVTVNDQANTGSGGALTDTGSFDIAVQAVNDQPHLTLPADQSVNEDTSLAISGISVADVDANGGDVEVTLSVGSGTLTLADTTGLTFSTGTGAGDASVTFTGTVADINAALTTLSYQGNLNFNGTDTLSVTVNDQANTGSGGVLTDTGSFDIAVQAVNDKPTSIGISGITVKEDSLATTINLFDAFDDVEDSDNQLQYTVIDVSNPALFRSVSLDETHGLLVLRYAADAFGRTDITVLVQDTQGASTTETFQVEVQAVNDAPVAAADYYTVHGDEVLVVNSPGVLTNDSDIDSNALTAVVLHQPLHGKLHMNPNGSFRYVPDPSFVGTDSFFYVATDGESASGRVRVFINVAAPISPIETNHDTPSTTPNGSSDSRTIDPSSQLSQLVLAELPTEILSAGDNSGASLRQRDSSSGDHALSMNDSSQLVASVTVHSESDDLDNLRTATRSRYADDLMESLAVPIDAAMPAMAVTAPDLADASPLWENTDSLSDLLDDDGVLDKLIDVSAISLATGLTVGYVFWTVRAGYLLTGLIAQMPAWRLVDPLPILSSMDGGSMKSDGESLESIVQSGQEGLVDPSAES